LRKRRKKDKEENSNLIEQGLLLTFRKHFFTIFFFASLAQILRPLRPVFGINILLSPAST
jgi:hypothetical protein